MERDQYPPIEKYLRQQWNCTRTWRAGTTPRVALKVPDPHQRVPDVVGARQVDAQWQTVIVEAKRRDAGHAVQQAIAQLAAVSDWADYLFLSIESADWDARNRQGQDSLEGDLKRRGFGLLLVDGKQVTARIEPLRNSSASETARNELLGQLEIDYDTAPRVIQEPLSVQQARVARSSFALVDESLWDAVDVWRAHFRKPTGSDPKSKAWTYYHHKPPTATLATSLKYRNLELEGDPFGCYRDDGVPVIWLWFLLKPAIKRVDAQFREKCLGWYYFAFNSLEEFKAPSVSDLNLHELEREGFTKTPMIGWPIRVSGRTKQAVLEELADTIRLVRQQRFKAMIKRAT